MQHSETPVDMDAPMTAEERAIWAAMWSVPEFRQRYGVFHRGKLLQREIAHYMMMTRQNVQRLEMTALRKLKIAYNKRFNNEI